MIDENELNKSIRKCILKGIIEVKGKFDTLLHIKDMENKKIQNEMLNNLKEFKPDWYDYYMYLESHEENML